MIPTKIRAGRAILGMAIVALVACKDKSPPSPKMSQVFPNLPLPPNATLLSRSGGTEALQITLRSSAKAKDVETYYRTTLTKNGWRLLNDMREKDGSVVLFAERNGPPLWVRIKSTDDSAATVVELAGAVLPDSATRAKPAS